MHTLSLGNLAMELSTNVLLALDLTATAKSLRQPSIHGCSVNSLNKPSRKCPQPDNKHTKKVTATYKNF